MRGSSNSRLAPLTFWLAALSVAIAIVGSSTLLFPGPDIGEPPATPVGRDIVDRILAPIFAPSPRERIPPPAAEAPASSAIVPVAPAVPPVTVPTEVAQERPARSGVVMTRRPGGDDGSPAARGDDGQGKGKRKVAKASKDEGSHGKATAGAKSQGHAYGHLKSTTSRGPKQSHVHPAKGHGKGKGRARAHARAGR